jgi:hypothetical protein
MKVITLKKLDEYYWEASFASETRTHVFPKHGAPATLRNVEILLNHGYQATNPCLLAQLKQEAEATENNQNLSQEISRD